MRHFYVSYGLRSLLFVAMVLFSFSSFSANKTQNDPKSSYHSTRLHEVKFFRDLPRGKYTVGYGFDERGKTVPLAIYDKMFPNLLDKRQLLKVFLAAIGIGDFNLQRVYEKIKHRRMKKKHHVLEEHFLKEIFDKGSQEKKLIYKSDWWKSPDIKWKSRCLSKLKDKPEKIPLDCIVIKKKWDEKPNCKPD